MKVQFEFTAADLADVGKRSMDRSPLVRRWRLQTRALWALVGGVLVYEVTPAPVEIRIVAGVVVALAVLIGPWLRPRDAANQRVLQLYREKLGGDGPFLCEVEITEAGVHGRQLGTESHRPWSAVASVSEVPGGVELVFRPMGSLLVRDRAFADATARAEFLATARRFQAKA